MTEFEKRGKEIREISKILVLDFMKSTPSCQVGGEGMRLSQIFRACGFDWGTYQKATSSNQQYWAVALIRELEAEGKVNQVSESGPWRLA
ncbi:MAG: hypothetical protein Q8S36_05895 [Sulfuricurvum sp.]|nr:hypothetical protein [Sulfuricurvum sp.]